MYSEHQWDKLHFGGVLYIEVYPIVAMYTSRDTVNTLGLVLFDFSNFKDLDGIKFSYLSLNLNSGLAQCFSEYLLYGCLLV